MRIYTSYFGKLKRLLQAGIMPVSIAAKQPAWASIGSYSALAPHPSWLQLSREEYTQLFCAKLGKMSPDQVLRDLAAMSDSAGGPDIALLCYEALRDPLEWCHRQMVAEWLRGAGVHIVEFEPAALPARSPVPPQETLF